MRIEYLVVTAPKVKGDSSEDAHAIDSGDGTKPFVAVVADGHGIQVDEEVERVRPSEPVVLFAQEIAAGLLEQFVRAPDFNHASYHFDVVGDRAELWRDRVNPRAVPGQQTVGAVASVVMVSSNTLHLAQTGDCRLYVSNRMQPGWLQLSEDHSALHPKEVPRIARAHAEGRLSLVHMYGRSYIHIIIPGTTWGRHLQPVRSFGDFDFGDLVPHTPECQSFNLEEDRLYALCSDGGNEIVEQVLGLLRDRADAPLDEIESLTRARCTDPEDDITIIWFRVART